MTATLKEPPASPPAAEPESQEASLDRLLQHVPLPEAAPRPTPAPDAAAIPALRTARVTAVRGKEASIVYRARGAEVTATLDEGVDVDLVKRALTGHERVLVEIDPEVGPVIVGVVQTRLPDVVEIKARKITLDADEELLLRSGRGAMRIREDGDVELVGSRVSTLSRGLFRIVGRVLRLN
jgi:hypothetical protein